MPTFEVIVEFWGSIRVFKTIQLDNVRIEPDDNGFLLKKIVEPQEQDLFWTPKEPLRQSSRGHSL